MNYPIVPVGFLNFQSNAVILKEKFVTLTLLKSLYEKMVKRTEHLQDCGMEEI